MTDESQTQSDLPDELTTLKQRAALMGITHSPNIGVETLRKKIQDRLDGLDEPEVKEEPAAIVAAEPKAKVLSPAELKSQIRQEMKLKHMALVRVRIACMNPAKRDLHGEIFTVYNKYIGTVRKFIQFDHPYHIEKILLEEVKARKFLNVQTKKKNGQIVVQAETYLPEFNVEILPPLTKEELAKLATTQAATQSVSME